MVRKKKSDKIKSLNIPSKLALPHQIGIGVTTDGRPFLTNADKFLVQCDIEKDDKQHKIQLCPDYTRCDCPPRSGNPDDKPHDSEDVCLHTDDNVGLLGGKTEDINTTPFPYTTSLNNHPHMEIKSSKKQKERGDISNYSTEGMTHTVQEGDLDSALDDCFSTAQSSAEDIRNKHINIINTIEEAGA